MGLNTLHPSGSSKPFAEEFYTGSLNKRDTGSAETLVNFYPEDEIISSPAGTLHLGNMSGDPAVRKRLYFHIQEIQDPLGQTSRLFFSSGWKLLAWMWPYPQDVSKTMRKWSGAKQALRASGTSGANPSIFALPIQIISGSARKNNAQGYDLDDPAGIVTSSSLGLNNFLRPWANDDGGFNFVVPFDALEGNLPGLGPGTGKGKGLVINDLQIIKNNDADVYWPEFGFNAINDFTPGEGYQFKFHAGSHQSFNLPALTESLNSQFRTKLDYVNALEEVRIDLVQGWNIVGYNRIVDGKFGTTLNKEAVYYLANTHQGSTIDVMNNCTFRSIASHGGGFAKELDHTPTALPGSVVLKVGDQVVGSGTSFTRDYSLGDTIKFDLTISGVRTKFQGQVTSVPSDTLITIVVIAALQPHLPLGTDFYYKDQEVTFASISESVEIMKNNDGGAYWPEYNFTATNFEKFTTGEAYQTRLHEAIVGFAFPVHSTTFKESLRPLIDQ